MKRILLVLILLIGFTAVSLSAWEPKDLTKYPSCMTNESWIINLGISLDPDIGNSGGGFTYLPTFRVTFDRNVALGNLPFFLGGYVGYTGWGYEFKSWGVNEKWFNHRIPLGFRVGYHFNWGVDNLDTYAVSTVGMIVNTKSSAASGADWLFMNFASIGVRYFLNDFFGFWAETGFGLHVFNFDLGVSFKF